MEKTDVMINKKKHTGGQGSARKILCWLLACSLLAAQFDTTVLAAEQTGIEILAESEAAEDTENNDDAEAVEEQAEDGEMDEADENAKNDDADAVNEIVADSETDRAKEGDASDISSGSETGSKSDASDKSAESKNESESGNSDATGGSVEDSSGSSEDSSGSSESSSGINIVISRNADVVFVIDATGSMYYNIINVKDKLIEFVNLMDQAGVDVRVRFVVYYDMILDAGYSHKGKTTMSDWYTREQINEASSYIENIVVTGGGGDGKETALDGMGQLFQDEFGWRESVSKFSILLTDESYKEDNTFGYNFDDIKDMLVKNDICSSAIVRNGMEDFDDWIVNDGKKGDIASSDYSFLLDWVEDVILPNVDMKYHNVNIEVKKDNVSWEEHGKNFILKNIDKGFYVGNLNAVENGSYQIYEIIVNDSYLYTGRTITVDEEDAAAVVDYYTMTFHDSDMAYGDDTPQHKRIIVSGLTTTKPENPEKNGYVFKQWVSEKGGHTGFDFSQPISRTVNLYAEWIPRRVDIIARKDGAPWDDNGRGYCLRPYVNSEESLASVISENDVFSDYITDLSSVSNGRYRVYELYITQVPDSDDIVNYVDTGLDFTVTDDNRTIFVDYYTVTFHDGDTIYGDSTSQHSQIVMKNKYASEPVKPVKECYVFNRWLTEKNGDTAFSFNQAVTNTTNLYAGWRDNRVTVNVRKDDIQWTGHGKLFALKKTAEDSYITLLTSVENGEYHVYEIYNNGETKAPEYRDTGAVVTVNNGDATVNVDYYTVTFYNDTVAYGDEEPQHRQIILKNHTAYAPPSPTKTGYSFVNWMTERENGIPFDFTRRIDAPVSVYADWTPNMVIITVRKDGELWDNHGKSFCITKDGGETYITDLSAVESGIYDIYEVISIDDTETPQYLDTGVNVTVTGGRVSGLIDYYTVTFYDKANAYDDATAQGRQIVIKNGNAVRPAKNPTKKGYRFKNWVTENKGKVVFDFSTRISEPVSVYASWAAKSSGSSSSEPVPEVKRNEPEPRTGDNYHVEIYASVAMIAGFGYLLLYFAENAGGMSEYQKDKLLSAITSWARKGSRMRRYAAIAAVFCVLCYYHSIGKRVAMEWETFA